MFSISDGSPVVFAKIENEHMLPSGRVCQLMSRVMLYRSRLAFEGCLKRVRVDPQPAVYLDVRLC